MVRTGLIFILVSVLAGSLFLTWKGYRESLEAHQKREAAMARKTTVAYAVREIKKGAIISADDVGLKEIPYNKSDYGLVKTIEFTIGKTSQSGMSQGQIFYFHDLDSASGIYLRPPFAPKGNSKRYSPYEPIIQ